MGLSVVAGFVQETASYISVQSEQGQGTTLHPITPRGRANRKRGLNRYATAPAVFKASRDSMEIPKSANT